jgi:hypothetical protein
MKPTWCAFHSFNENLRPLHVSSITCSSSGGASKRHLVYCLRIMSADIVRMQYTKCRFAAPPEDETATVPQPTDMRTQYTKFCFSAPPEGEQVMLETCRGFRFSINWMKSASRWFNCTDPLSLIKVFFCLLQSLQANAVTVFTVGSWLPLSHRVQSELPYIRRDTGAIWT